MSTYTSTRQTYYQNNSDEIKEKRKNNYQKNIIQEREKAKLRHIKNKKQNNKKSRDNYNEKSVELNKKRRPTIPYNAICTECKNLARTKLFHDNIQCSKCKKKTVVRFNQ